MQAAIEKLVFWFSLIPKILEQVKKLEEIIPMPGAGKAKLDLMLGAIHAIYDAEQTIQKEIPFQVIESAVTKAVGIIVAMLNSLGVFKKS